MVVDVQQVETVSLWLRRTPRLGADPPKEGSFIQTDTNACLFLINLMLLVRGDETLEEDIPGDRLCPSAGLFNVNGQLSSAFRVNV